MVLFVLMVYTQALMAEGTFYDMCYVMQRCQCRGSDLRHGDLSETWLHQQQGAVCFYVQVRHRFILLLQNM